MNLGGLSIALEGLSGSPAGPQFLEEEILIIIIL
jgi:hypothetical protein